ncbi:hypothetical protein [Spirosoma pomorum]
MKQGNVEDEGSEGNFAPDSLATDDSFALLLALYRSRVYEQYHTQFTDNSFQDVVDNKTASSLSYTYNFPQ